MFVPEAERRKAVSLEKATSVRGRSKPVIRDQGATPSGHLGKCSLPRGQAQAGGFLELWMLRAGGAWDPGLPP